MGTADEAIYGRLTTDAAASALLGDRVFKLYADQASAYPRAVVETADDERPRNYAGATGQLRCEATVTCIDRTYKGAKALARAVRDALDNQSGTWGGAVVQRVFYDGASEHHDEPEQGSDEHQYTRELRFRVWLTD
jgi:hypothetical protein